MSLTDRDRETFAAIGVGAALLDSAGVRRVSHTEARDLCGIRYKSEHLEGVAFPYRDPDDDRVWTWRVRRDHPELEADGSPIAKYVSPPDRKHLYIWASGGAQLANVSAPVLIVEAEKSVLAIEAARLRADRTPWPLVIGVGGCWGWRGVTGKATGANGARVDVKGALSDFDRVTWTDRDVAIIFDANTATNSKVLAARRALAHELTRRGAAVRLVDLPVEPGTNGPDDYIGRHGDAAFWRLVDQAQPARDDGDEANGRGRGPSQSTMLVDLALASGVELWHTPTGDTFATVNVDGHQEHHPLRRVVRDYLARVFYTSHKRSPASAALTDALATLGGMARYDGPEHATAVRLGRHDDAIYLDLGDAAWRAVEIDADGWRVVDQAPVRHWRPSSLRALPGPQPGGRLDALRDLWPNLDDDNWILAASWLVSTVAPTGPYPVLVEVGEQGCGKSTLGRMLRGLVDPASPALRGVPRDERDVMIGALASHLVALDNLSGLPVWLSDALCRIATGGGLATRTLYSDLDETLIDVMKPILLTGIDSPATRGDLLDRALVITLPAMSDSARGDEAALWQRYEALRPVLVGALCDAASMALRRRAEVRLERRPRMADACTWVTAAEPALGWTTGSTAMAWMGSRRAASADLVSGDPIAQALLAMPMATTPWEGTAAVLLEVLNTMATAHTRTTRAWPASPRGLSGALRRLAPDMRRVGVDVELPTNARTARERIITIRRGCVQQDTQDRQDTEAGALNVSSESVRPVGSPVGPTGHLMGHQQDTDSANESGPLSDVSCLSGSTHPDHVVDPAVDDDGDSKEVPPDGCF